MMQERLDPIDWATYEPYLWANETAFCRRSAVLFGALTRLSASPPQARPTSHACTEHMLWSCTEFVLIGMLVRRRIAL